MRYAAGFFAGLVTTQSQCIAFVQGNQSVVGGFTRATPRTNSRPTFASLGRFSPLRATASFDAPLLEVFEIVCLPSVNSGAAIALGPLSDSTHDL
ncbi:MAG: hypothetical protein QNI91_15300 [Arenicellales bacterium]|nr:hypothetical protein [Arenicellales bacterium]